MELAGHKCVGFCEFDKYAVMSYTSMHLITDEQRSYLETLPMKERQKEILKEEYRNGEWYANDIIRVYAGDIPKADCWCFGFPCQDISVAGKQMGFQGNRSSLFFRVMYLLGQIPEEERPTYLFIENVKNLLSVNGGWDFARLLVEMDRGGYDAEWQVLNSKYFRVPQNRERCFIIGHFRNRSTPEVFPVEGTDGEDSIYRIRQIGGVKGTNRDNPNQFRVYEPNGVSPTLNKMDGGGREPHTIEVIGKAYDRDNYGDNRNRILGSGGGGSESNSNTVQRAISSGIIVVGNTNPSGHGMNGNCYYSEGVNPTLTCNKNEGSKIAIPVLTPERQNKRQNGRRMKEDGDEAFTLTGQDKHGVAVEVHPVSMSGNKLSECDDEAHSLNCSDQRKKFGANQIRTMVGYNATLNRGGYNTDSNDVECKGLQGTVREQSDDDSSLFAIDKGIRPKQRKIANCIESREDRGLSKRNQEGTLICLKLK